MTVRMTRREATTLVGAALVAPSALAQTGELLTRAIPSSGERLPAIGLGTARVFDTGRDDTAEDNCGNTGVGRKWWTLDRHGFVLW